METLVEVQTISKGDSSPFVEHPDFYRLDNRQHRGLYRITKETLEARMSTLLPNWLVRDKTVLDLGSCLGAAGEWVLYNGAKSYTGVELQPEYAELSKRLLAHWGPAARVHTIGIREFLDETNDQNYDVVLAAGVLYLFIDPKEIIDRICKITNDVVVVETKHTKSVMESKLKPSSLVLEYEYKQGVNLADGLQSLVGISASLSYGALDFVFKLNGFYKNEALLQFPINEHTAVYTDGSATGVGLPSRYAVRFFRSAVQGRQRTLEDNLPTKTGARRDWATSKIDVEHTARNNRAASHIQKQYKKWEFNEEVAKQFDSIADTSIPNYRQVLTKAVEIIQRSGLENPKIIDVGSATGNTLHRLYDAGFRNLYGVDASEDMLSRSFDKATLIHSETFPKDHGPFDVIIANWVLHFIRRREEYLKDIAASLNPDGLLIVSEKVISSELTHNLYYDFKRKNGISEEEIEKKRQQLAGVLETYPLEWYFTTLRESGFNKIDIIDASYAFVTLLAQR